MEYEKWVEAVAERLGVRPHPEWQYLQVLYLAGYTPKGAVDEILFVLERELEVARRKAG